MIVRLTHTQGRVVMDRVPELHATRMQEHRRAYGRSQHDYTLPAIGWRQVLDKLMGGAYGPNGGKLRNEPVSLYTAISRIANEVAKVEHHPGLSGHAVIGVQPDVLPVWKYTTVSMRPGYDIYPVYTGEFGTLFPHLRAGNGRDFTEWVFGPPFELQDDLPWEFDERFHLEFVTTP
jgi:hypothetical protein